MFGATSDDGKALIAELGNDALQANNVRTRTSDADRAQITQLLIARGANQPISHNHINESASPSRLNPLP